MTTSVDHRLEGKASNKLVSAGLSLELRQRFIDQAADLLAEGKTPADIAMMKHPHDKLARRRLRTRLRKMTYTSVELRNAVAARAHGKFVNSLGPMTDAVITRTLRTGRHDGMKFLSELFGFYAPKQQHEHSGEISINIISPRPARTIEEPIVDADVVD